MTYKVYANESIHPYGDFSKYNETFGLTKREHFAAQALIGILADPHRSAYFQSHDMANQAVLLADALIEELNK